MGFSTVVLSCSSARRTAVSVVLAALVVLAGLGLATPRAAAFNGAGQTSFTFEGGGWGHGVGMSQFGAYGRAAAGQSSTDIIKAYYQGVSIEQRSVTNNVRVALSTSTSTTASFGGKATIKLDGKTISTVAAWKDIAISRQADRWAITAAGQDICVPQPVPEGADPVPSPCIGRTLRLVVKDLVEQHLTTSEHSYRHGRLELTPTSDGSTSFYVVLGQLTMDEYLYGLAEMPSSWPTEALKAQAIAGRSYAEARILSRRGDASRTLPYDLDSSTRDQVYAGNSKETGDFSANWVAAVDATSGIVGTYEGAVIDALYGSSNGGHSANSEYAFANFVPYLRAAPDAFDGHENPLASWTRTYGVDELSRWLARDGSSDVGTLQSLSIGGNVGVSGRVNKATVTLTGSSGTKSITGESFRWIVNAGLAAEGRFSRDDQILSTNYSYSGPTDQLPFGSYVKVVAGTDRVQVSGWAMDLDTSDPIKVKVSIDGQNVKTRLAKRNKKALASKYNNGTKHGFRIAVKAMPGVHTVCVKALNNQKGQPNTDLGCKKVEVATSTVPVGELEIVRQAGTAGTAIRVAGWALDPSTDDPIRVAIDVDRTEVATTTARYAHAGLGQYGRGDDHGFDATIPVSPGTYQVCARAISTSGAVAVIIGCKDISVG